MADFVPTSESSLILFLKNFVEKFLPYAVAAGVPAAECDAFKTRVLAYCSSSETLEQDRAKMEQRTLDRDTERADILTVLRGFSNRIKVAPGGESAAKDLQVTTSSEGGKADLTPTLTVGLSAKGPEIKFTNPTKQGVNVYRQIIGVDAKPVFLARDTRSPYIDTEEFPNPVKIAYSVVAVKNDEEVSGPSDMVTITYGG